MLLSDDVRRAHLLTLATLVLNRSWLPVHVTTVRRALCMVVRGVARIVAPDTLSTHSFMEWIQLQIPPMSPFIRSPSVRVAIPEVVVLNSYDKVPCHEAPFTRRNLFLRDDFTCQYCGGRCTADRLSVDHVVPRSRGGKTTWDNCVLACVRCNARKADRTIKEAGLKLLRAPRRPRWTPYINLRSAQLLESWQRFVPESRRGASFG
ncbi:MAG: HNH endonuclease [Planctomycetota bacterium]|nr:HNH endonuclease [Planctomycetota bacterium]